MDFVQWCDVFLGKSLELQEASETAAYMGVRVDHLGPVLLGGAWSGVPQADAISQALADLKQLGIIEQDLRLPQYLKIPRRSRDLAVNQQGLWGSICAQGFEADEARLLRTLNRLSEQRRPDFTYLEMVPYEALYSELGLGPGYDAEQDVDRLVRNLQALGYAKFGRAINRSNLAARPTYAGLVWEHRRSITVSSQAIDALVAEGETPTVDLKRQLAVDTASQKAEFIKDIVALANTKATGSRYLLVGFANEGDYYEPADPRERAEWDRLLASLNEERLQTIASKYTTPALQIRYTKAEYHLGPVGIVEVVRDATQLPYEVRETLGSTDRTNKGARQVRAGQVFVRDGTVTREARPDEIERMGADVERAKQRQ